MIDYSLNKSFSDIGDYKILPDEFDEHDDDGGDDDPVPDSQDLLQATPWRAR